MVFGVRANSLLLNFHKLMIKTYYLALLYTLLIILTGWSLFPIGRLDRSFTNMRQILHGLIILGTWNKNIIIGQIIIALIGVRIIVAPRGRNPRWALCMLLLFRFLLGTLFLNFY